jgi:predicted ABC-type ATPase
MPKLYIIAGPNGSGKTTFAKEFLPHYAKCPNFVNADLIAQGLAPFSPATVSIKAGRLLLDQIKDFVNQKADFAFETTLAGRTYRSLIKTLKTKGYSVHLFFLWIPDAELARERIRQRVKEGGHNVPEADINRRFKRSLNNFLTLYKPDCDFWTIFDNSADKPKVIAKFTEEGLALGNKLLFEKFMGGKYHG